ncbi:MAG: transporter substrate-binding domain-containing protein, partial [Deltaproteobacteria bacterium]|nr:transporter substrate-binding domain-containing protein [Deltaproteobacteria bacterium]
MERREKKTHILSIWLITSAALFASVPASADSHSVRVAIHDSPFSSVDDNGQAQGFYVDIIEHIAAAEGWDVAYEIGTWTEIVAKFERGQVDLLFPIVPSEHNALRYDFSDEPLLSTWGAVFARPKTGIESLLDLAGRRVAVVEGDLFGRELEALLAKFELSCEIEPVASTDAVFEAITAGRVDAGAVERMDGYLHARQQEIEQTPIVFTPVSAHIAAAKGKRPDVLRAIDQHLVELKADRESLYYRSYASWFEHGPDLGFPAWAKWALVIGGGLLVILFAFAVALRIQVGRRTRELSAQNVVLAQEITHRERTEDEKNKLEAQLLQSQKLEAIGHLAGGVAHDFNNMLGAIVGCGELALHKLPRHEPARKEVRQVIDVAEKAASLTQQLLAFSRKQNLRPQVIGMNALIEDTRKMLGRLIGEQIQLETSLANDLWSVEVDPGQLQQVIINLAVNAR